MTRLRARDLPGLVLLPALALAAAVHASPSLGQIEVRVIGLRSEAGTVRVKLVDAADGFPASDRHVVAKQKAPARTGGVTFRLGRVPYGEYALIVLHDEDDDAELDRGLLGLPREGLGFSRGARVRFGPPGYEEARFPLAEPELRLTIELEYR